MDKKIRQAFQNKDPELSKNLHSSQDVIKALERTPDSANKVYIKSIINGGLKGLISTMSIISSFEGIYFNSSNIKNIDIMILLCICNLLSISIYEGISKYLTKMTKYKYILNEYEREKWELDNNAEGEKNEMIEIYTKKHNLLKNDAIIIVNTMFKYPPVFLDTMFFEELGLFPPEKNILFWKNGLITSFSSITFGIFPLSIYIIPHLTKNNINICPILYISNIIFLTCIINLGIINCFVSTQTFLKSIFNIMIPSFLCIISSFVIGYSIRNYII